MSHEHGHEGATTPEKKSRFDALRTAEKGSLKGLRLLMTATPWVINYVLGVVYALRQVGNDVARFWPGELPLLGINAIVSYLLFFILGSGWINSAIFTLLAAGVWLAVRAGLLGSVEQFNMTSGEATTLVYVLSIGIFALWWFRAKITPIINEVIKQIKKLLLKVKRLKWWQHGLLVLGIGVLSFILWVASERNLLAFAPIVILALLLIGAWRVKPLAPEAGTLPPEGEEEHPEPESEAAAATPAEAEETPRERKNRRERERRAAAKLAKEKKDD
jgi:hypothetical protein